MNSCKFDTNIWNNFAHDGLELELRFAMIWFHTNPHINEAGAFRISLDTFTRETGLAPEWAKKCAARWPHLFACSGEWVLIKAWLKLHLRVNALLEAEEEEKRIDDLLGGLASDLALLPRDVQIVFWKHNLPVGSAV